MPYLPTLTTARLQHRALAWTQATLHRSAHDSDITVPAGKFKVRVLTAQVQGGMTHTFYVDSSAPHAIVRWTTSDGENAELLGSDRLKYWEMNGQGGEAALKKLGLPVPP